MFLFFLYGPLDTVLPSGHFVVSKIRPVVFQMASDIVNNADSPEIMENLLPCCMMNSYSRACEALLARNCQPSNVPRNNMQDPSFK